ncbi:MAG: M48 family metalloprotease [Pseudomonadota bacterium]|nr:M48 family metalloprotease [Pseudomonadota bacterium]
MKTIKPNQRRLALLLSLTLLASTPVNGAGAGLNLPEMGDASATILSADEDKRLGQAFMRNIRSQVQLVESPEINTYINTLGYRLLGSANSQQPFTFFVVDDPSINAFAGPGGYIGIHTGLILAAESEGELAAVMAHEIAHVTQRHLARAFQKASGGGLQTAAAILAAILIGNPNVTQAAIALSAASNIQKQLNFTRDHEREADRVGIETLAQAGYDPRQMPAFFTRLQQATRYMQSDLPELLRTHPVTPSRIADSSNRAEQFAPVKAQESDDFYLIQALLHTHHDERQERLKSLTANREPTIAQIYEQALWQLDAANLPQAEALSQKLLSKAPEKDLFIALQARIELQQNNLAAAEQRLGAALKLYPNHPLLTTLQVETLLRQDKAAAAVTLLRRLILQQERFPLPGYYQLLAKAEMANGRDSDSYQALAEFYYLIGHTRTAVEQLKIALERTSKEDSFRWQRLNSRLTELQGEVLELEAKEGKRGPT